VAWVDKRDLRLQDCGVNLLVGDEDLERADDLGERDGLVGLPVLCRLYIIDEDDEVLVLALVVDLGLLSFASGHDCDMKYGVRGSVWFGLV
jgi:hypothetical protein